MPFDGFDTGAALILPPHAGVWWKGHEAELQAALLVAESAAPHLTDLAHMLLPRLPRYVLASSSIKGADGRPSSRRLPLAEALQHQWIAFNGKSFVNTESADIDEPVEWRSGLSDMVNRHGLPMPAAMVASPWRGTVHLLWIYETPFSNRCEAATRLRRGIKRGLRMLGACPRFANRLQKNPWHRAGTPVVPDEGIPSGDRAIWEGYCAESTGLTYHTEILALGTVQGRDLFSPLAAEATGRKITLLERRPEKATGRQIPLSVSGAVLGKKGSRLFHAAAQATRRACTGDFDQIHDLVSRTASAMRSPAGASQIVSIATSITEWMNSLWRGPLDGRSRCGGSASKPVNTGVMKVEASKQGGADLALWRTLDTQGRQSAAANRTNRVKRQKNDDAVRTAMEALVREGEAVTQAAVARRAGVSLSTVERRWGTLEVVRGGRDKNPSYGLIRLSGKPPVPQEEPLVIPSEGSACSMRVLAKEVRASRAVDRHNERKVIRRFRTQASRLMRRGARDEIIPTLRPGCSTLVQAAHAEALVAQSDLRRRLAGREQRERQKMAAQDREAWHTEYALAEGAWMDRLERLERNRDLALSKAEDRERDVDRIRLMFASIFSAEYRARRRARGEPERASQSRFPYRDRRRNPRVQAPTSDAPCKRPQQAKTVPSTYTQPAFMRRRPPSISTNVLDHPLVGSPAHQ
ncbi:replication initiation protein [Muricoccus aerilatus]|uniref:replication initiation protein n=1 Tax=Muricoccus aerilatus TaxID=452982 RepID=UPI000A535C3F|nr:replication initiation protein [Roseomonas aerilata]